MPDSNNSSESQARRAAPNTGQPMPGEAKREEPTDPSKIPDPNADPRDQINELNSRAPGLGTLEDQANKGNLK